MTDLAAAATRLRALHRPGDPLVLPNAWDARSARLVVAAGFPVVATSSAAVAEALGFGDGDSMPPDEAFAAVARIAAAVPVPVTADLEAGYQLSPDEFVRRLLDAGAVGCNLEDSDHHGGGVLVPADEQARRLSAVRAAASAAGVDIVINARIDAFIRQVGDLDAVVAETVRRARLYVEAGADCVFPIHLADEDAIAAVVRDVGAPVNVTARRGAPTIGRLAELGVARVSFGSGMATAAYGALEEALARAQTGSAGG